MAKRQERGDPLKGYTTEEIEEFARQALVIRAQDGYVKINSVHSYSLVRLLRMSGEFGAAAMRTGYGGSDEQVLEPQDTEEIVGAQ
ncbi:MAG: hypothetical protein AAB541_02650 [Patescibacteria group bacterium]